MVKRLISFDTAAQDGALPLAVEDYLDKKVGGVAGLLAGWTADAVGGRNLVRRRNLEAYGGSFFTMTNTGEKFSTGEDIYHAEKIATGTPPIELSPRFTIEPGETFTASVWGRAGDPESPEPYQLMFYNSEENKSLASAYGDANGGEWYRLEVTYTNTTNEPLTRVHVYAYPERKIGTDTWFSSTKLERGPKATEWTPALEDLVSHVQGGSPLDTFPSPLPPADPGLQLRVDNSVGTRVFVGDTMIYGNTGRRNLTGLLDDPGSGRVSIAREGNVVWLEFYSVPTDGSSTFQRFSGVLPAGFRSPFSWQYLAITPWIGRAADGPFRVGVADEVIVYGVSGKTEVTGTVMFKTADPWPATLPGTPF